MRAIFMLKQGSWQAANLVGKRFNCTAARAIKPRSIQSRSLSSAGWTALPLRHVVAVPRLLPIVKGFVTSAAASEAVAMAPTAALRRLDYKPTPYLIDQVLLDFDLHEESAIVKSKLHFVPNPANLEGASTDIVLNGRIDLKLVSVRLDGQSLDAGSYQLTPTTLTISNPPTTAFKVEIETLIEPQNNTLLEGLYKSDGIFCSQCEAEGFRGITFFYDRPDVLAIYTVRVTADKYKYPVLLSNGNLIEEGDAGMGRHFAVWNDPFRKPCYLFALVAGDLAVSEDHFKTCSGRDIKLRIFSDEANIASGKVDWAMVSLKKAMAWDEEVYGLEYDLDVFHIVAVSSFNMGAMENKGLNIFNSRLVLASPESATDADYQRIEAVVAHEYFHNWTGNRVTCRDWFQLTLKEGLTVYRDHEFSSDMNSRAVRRIDDVMLLRSAQFTEDAGPMSHAVRPDAVKIFDNFYSLTVYEKGSEVVRMYEAILGKAGFRKGMNLYFERHDGQAVTCDDFLAAMADANDENLSTLGIWYMQAGTPTLSVQTVYDTALQTFSLTFTQSTPPTTGQPNKLPVLIPVSMGLLGPDGQEVELKLQGSPLSHGMSTVLRIEKDVEHFVFENVTSKPVPSLLRGFSAPVKLNIVGQSDADLAHLLAHDTDLFNRWEASQLLAKKVLLSMYEKAKACPEGSAEERAAQAGEISVELLSAFTAVLTEHDADGAFVAAAVTLPSSGELQAEIKGADPLLLHWVRVHAVRELARALRPHFEAVLAANDDPAGQPYSPDAHSAARRAVKGKALAYLSCLGDSQVAQGVLERFRRAENMTDQMSCLAALNDRPGHRELALAEFYEQWKGDDLVVLKWLGLSAGANVEGNQAAVERLLSHPAFDITKPNCCYGLFLGFARSAVNFHAEDGSGYTWFADMVMKVDKVNRQVGARMVSAFNSWRNYDPARQAQIVAELRRITACEGLSANVAEIATMSLPSDV